MSKSVWPFLLLLLMAYAPKLAVSGTNQTLRAGELEVAVSAPAWVTRQEFYPLKVTYTNRLGQPVNRE